MERKEQEHKSCGSSAERFFERGHLNKELAGAGRSTVLSGEDLGTAEYKDVRGLTNTE